MLERMSESSINKELHYCKALTPAAHAVSGPNYHLDRFGVGVQGHEEDLHDALLADGKRDAQVAEWVEGHGDLLALGTDEC